MIRQSVFANMCMTTIHSFIKTNTNFMYDYFRTGHQNPKPFNDVFKVQEGRHIPEHKVHARQGDGGRRHTARVRPILLGALVPLFLKLLYSSIMTGNTAISLDAVENVQYSLVKYSLH